jgi:acetylornithine deacetylase/succinyl-diaminopimelate desuccinylase-like protein
MRNGESELLLDEISTIANIPAPTFEEEARLEWLVERLRQAPGNLHRDAARNLIWSWGDGRPQLLVTAHVDTVFPRRTSLGVERDGNWLVGPGVGDNAAAIAVTIRVVEHLLRTQRLAPAAVAFTVCEEGLGNLRGARQACSDLAPTAVLAVEGHGLDAIVADAHGSIRARIAVEGPGGHAWTNRDRPSAVHALLRIGAEAIGLGTTDDPVNIGLLEGGLSINAIAETAELLVEKRALDPTELASFKGFLQHVRCEPPLEARVELLGERAAGTLPRDDPLLKSVERVRHELGLPNVLESGSTDANAAMGLGIPALSIGISRGRDMHTRHERIDIASLDDGMRQLEMVLTARLTARQ